MSDAPAKNGGPAQIKEEEEEVDEQPAAKRKRGQTKKEAKSKEEVKSEGNIFIYLFTYHIDLKCNYGCQCFLPFEPLITVMLSLLVLVFQCHGIFTLTCS